MQKIYGDFRDYNQVKSENEKVKKPVRRGG